VGAQITTSVTILNSLLGYQGISLTNMTATTEPQIAAGSKIEIAGAFFTFASNDSLNASSWTAATTAATAYIALTPSGTAGSQIVSGSWTSTAPEWSTSKQGWYTTTGSNIRIIGGCTKTNPTTWTDKFILQNLQEEQSRKLKLLTTASVGTNLTVGGNAQIAGTASVTSNLTVGGTAQITGTASVTSNLTVGGFVKTSIRYSVTSYYHEQGVGTFGGLYTAMEAHIPNINDEMLVCGSYISVNGPVIIFHHRARRTGADNITLYGMLFNHSTPIYQTDTKVIYASNASAYQGMSYAW